MTGFHPLDGARHLVALGSERHDLVTAASLFGLDAERLDGQRVSAAASVPGEGDAGIVEADGKLVSEDVDLFAGREFH